MEHITLPTDVAIEWSREILNQALNVAEVASLPIPLKLDGIGAVSTYDEGTKIAVSFHFTCAAK